jgi:type IV secretion system protein VirB3
MSKNNGIIVDPLFVGPTRPSTVWGVTYPAFLLNAIIVMEAFIMTRNLLWLGLFVPIHGICYLICKHDPQTFDLFRLWGMTKGVSYLGRIIFKGNFRFWKSSTYTPLEIQVGKARKFSFRRRASPTEAANDTDFKLRKVAA